MRRDSRVGNDGVSMASLREAREEVEVFVNSEKYREDIMEHLSKERIHPNEEIWVLKFLTEGVGLTPELTADFVAHYAQWESLPRRYKDRLEWIEELIGEDLG